MGGRRVAVPAAVPRGEAGVAARPAAWRPGGPVLVRVAVVALLLVVLGVAGLVQGSAAERLAREYAVTGVGAEAAEVWTYAEWRRDGTTVVDAEVILEVDGQEVAALLTGLRPEVTTTELGWWPAAPDTRYAAPLRVLRLPGEPAAAMAVADLEHHLAYTPTAHLLLVVLGLAPSTLLLLARLLPRRRTVPAAPRVVAARPPVAAPPPVLPTPRSPGPGRAAVAPPTRPAVTWFPAAPGPTAHVAQHPTPPPPLPGTRRARRALQEGLVDAPRG